jgi:hypothetical protein
MVRSGDAGTDHWWGDRAIKIAAGLRGFKKHILNPAEGSWEEVADQARGMFIHAASGEWGRLPVSIPEPSNLPGLGKRWLNAVWSIGVAAFPLGFLWMLRAVHLEPEPPYFELFKLVAIIWFLVSQLMALDSQFASKLAVIRDLLPYGGKGKKD